MKLIIAILISCLSTFVLFPQENNINVLVFSKTQGFRHKSIPTGVEFLSNMANNNNWNIQFSEDSNCFSINNLSKYNVLVFLNTSGNIFSEEQKAALQYFFARGKGFVGIHSASNTEMQWDWFTEMIGATFKDHPKVQSATLLVNTNSHHPAINGLNNQEEFMDEWYNFLKPVGKHVTVLASLDENSYEGKKMNTKNHPISWYHIYDGGRVFYTGLGHTVDIYKDIRYYSHIEGAILWASGRKQEPPDCKKWTNLTSEDPYENWDVFIVAPHATVKGIDGIDQKRDGKN